MCEVQRLQAIPNKVAKQRCRPILIALNNLDARKLQQAGGHAIGRNKCLKILGYHFWMQSDL